MDATTNAASDVLHAGDHSKLSAEEVAKAIARHNRHHASQHPQGAGATADKRRKA
jgi:hypothetical protein